MTCGRNYRKERSFIFFLISRNSIQEDQRRNTIFASKEEKERILATNNWRLRRRRNQTGSPETRSQRRNWNREHYQDSGRCSLL